jgi:hypothetical protein
MIRKSLPLLLLCLCGTGCGKPTASVNGSLLLNGKPFSLPEKAGEVFVVFQFIGADGKPDMMKQYSAVVKQDGTFVLVASEGQISTGKYLVAIDASPTTFPQAKQFMVKQSKVRKELKSGPNSITLELSQPEG